MTTTATYFFCGIGGSGMLPLALVLRAGGGTVAGSDRSRDQGRTPEKFAFIAGQGIVLAPQDGSGPKAGQMLVVSAAVEETVPDVVAARRLGLLIVPRAQLLARLANQAARSIAVGGTSGKSTTTGMIGWILHHAGQNPTIINGAVMKNFMTGDRPFASALVGDPDLFVLEVDESDGSIARFTPEIAVLNNIGADHKSLEELRTLFGSFVARGRTAVLNLDNAETAALAKTLPNALTYSLAGAPADIVASGLRATGPDGIAFAVRHGDKTADVALRVPGAHNVSNALAAIAAASACGVDLATAARALGGFAGIGRRLDTIGRARGVTVIDDFATNPDKIAASLRTVQQAYRRAIVLFQPVGFGPLRQYRRELVDAFRAGLQPNDALFVTDPPYFGGTADKSYAGAEFAADLAAAGCAVAFHRDRADAIGPMTQAAQPGDAILVLGARDDSLTQYARDILAAL